MTITIRLQRQTKNFSCGAVVLWTQKPDLVGHVVEILARDWSRSRNHVT